MAHNTHEYGSSLINFIDKFFVSFYVCGTDMSSNETNFVGIDKANFLFFFLWEFWTNIYVN